MRDTIIGGIIGYGAYVPRFRIKTNDIARAHNKHPDTITSRIRVTEKSVPAHDEDAITMGVHAAQNALTRAQISPKIINALYMGSESHPYAVKPSSTIVGQTLGLSNRYSAVDMEFACKGATAALQSGLSFVNTDMGDYALIIGSDTAQAHSGDILEYATGAGSAAFIVTQNIESCCAYIHKTLSISSDTPDFWRRPSQTCPQHAGRFTGTPAYFHHTIATAQAILEESNLQARDFDYVVFHQPNGAFPASAAKKLGFKPEQYEPFLLVKQIGNTYSASSLLALTAVLDQAQPDQKILLVSYGSGSGSDAFIITTTELITHKQKLTKQTHHYISHKTYIDYTQYQKQIARQT